MDIEKLLPTEPEFTIRKTGKSYKLRKVGVKDHAWLIEMAGSKDAANAIFRQKNLSAMAKFVYRLLSQADRADFMAKEDTRINEDGIKETKMLSGPEVLLDSLDDETGDETNEMVKALTAAMMKGNPEADKAVRAFIEDQKKRMAESQSQLTGERSGTSSQASTDTPSTNLET